MVYLKDLTTGLKTKGRNLDIIIGCKVDLTNCVVIEPEEFEERV